MLTLTYLTIFSSVLSASALTSPALDGPAPVSGIWARNPLLSFRDNIIYCASTGGATYCTDSVCCGLVNCMPADAECCTNGQYCLSGTSCYLQGNTMTCLDTSGSSSTPNTKTGKSGAGRNVNGAGAALVVAGAVGLFL